MEPMPESGAVRILVMQIMALVDLLTGTGLATWGRVIGNHLGKLL